MSGGYLAGRADLETAERHHRYEVCDAVRSWKQAQDDHGHTSYYGANHVRQMRAYWLGVLRLQRELNLGFHTHRFTAVAVHSGYGGPMWRAFDRETRKYEGPRRLSREEALRDAAGIARRAIAGQS